MPDTTFVSGTVTFTGAAALAAESSASKSANNDNKKDGLSSFAIIGKLFCQGSHQGTES